MKEYSSLYALFKDVGLSICKKHKQDGLSAICPLEFAEKIDSIETGGLSDIPLGEVRDLSFSIIGGILTVRWNDPLDVMYGGTVASKFKMTKLLAKLDTFPANHDDGTVLYSSTVRDQHSETPLVVDLDALGLVQEGHEICFKFFSSNTNDAWNDEFLTLGANEFSSLSYDWSMLYSALKDYPHSKDISALPDAGDYIYVDYIVRDYYISNNVNVMCETRADVVNNIDKLSSVSIPWRVLGYNANVPEHVGYRRFDQESQQHQYLYVKSVDDTLSAAQCFWKDGTTSTIQFETGNNQFRSITAGCRTYAEEDWDYQTNRKQYISTGSTVEAVSETMFGYNNEGTGTQNVYYVPMKLSVDGNEYDFCGYTMTIQPQSGLISINRTSNTAAATYSTIQFDAPEIEYASPFISFPADAADSSQYFTIQSDGVHEIDWTLSAGIQVNALDYDVYKLESSRLKLQTSYFQKYHCYKLMSDEGGTASYEPLVEILDFQLSTAYYTKCEAKNYNKANMNLSVVADIVRWNGQLYVCKANVPASNTNDPSELTANFRALSSAAELSIAQLYADGKYFVPGQKMPFSMLGKQVVEMNMLNCSNYGRNIYEQSFYKQYCNNIDGSRRASDSPYRPMHIFDNVSTVNLANANSLMLKLYKEQQMIRHIVKAANRTVISSINGPYRPVYLDNNRQTWETSIDLFWPLANYEVFGSGADASSTFFKVYPDNASRIKHLMTADGSEGTTAVTWWLRYPKTDHSHYEYFVNLFGASGSYSAYNSFGLAPACIIG